MAMGQAFGTKTGNGFSELAEYDSDGNGWIDENDEWELFCFGLQKAKASLSARESWRGTAGRVPNAES